MVIRYLAVWQAKLLGTWLQIKSLPDQRGLSQSTENAVLLAGAVTVAGIVISVITAFVKTRLPE